MKHMSKLLKKWPHKRTWLGLIVRPEKQMKYALLFTGGAVLCITALVAQTAVVFNHTLKHLSDTNALNLEIGLLLKDSMVTPFLIMVSGGFIIGILAVLFSVRLSNKIYGPLIPLQRHIKNLKDGHYGSRAVLREGDEFMELRDSLNELAAILEARHSK